MSRGKGIPHPNRQSNKEYGWYGSPLEVRLRDFLFEKCGEGCTGDCYLCLEVWDKYIANRPRSTPVSIMQFHSLVMEFSKV